MAIYKVGILMGGRSSEHEVSLMSASSVLEFLDRERFEPVPLGITRQGQWLSGPGVLESLQNGTAVAREEVPVETLRQLDLVFPVLHGPFGEDGTVQGLLEMLDVPYVGSGVAASGVGMDKRLMKHVFRDVGLPVVDFLTFTHQNWQEGPALVGEEVVDKLGLPCFVKPTNLGSSVGISKVGNREALTAAMTLAFAHDPLVLVESFVPGRELECSVLGNESPRTSVVGEVIPREEFYNYRAKYTEGLTEYVVPAQVDDETSALVRNLSVQAFQAIGASGLARVDFFWEENTGRVLVNEINTMPGFTRFSMYPKMWQASGLQYSDLVSRLLELALERHRGRSRYWG